MTPQDPEAAKLVDAILDAYNTTRLAETPASTHVLSKPYVQQALRAYLAAAECRCISMWTDLSQIMATISRAIDYASPHLTTPQAHSSHLAGVLNETRERIRVTARKALGD